ncbi:hypothetical protein [Halomicrobium sp. LC1Hm]|uniref:DUF7116 family protein n=1 Tax=Halomicrobium sp. LC1Hm TaxID=2610902 RepID=UPI0012982F69|nr:hypothetical protein [Halomicrobium sp. LC1Hm]QGA82930.1 Uncharacterized protein LC1Hm_1888 [Halomicrobium sp. LC1Hm]
MAAVTTSLADQASSIFADLGYSVSRTDGELRAERKWRVVRVTCSAPSTIPTDGRHRCFVTEMEDAVTTYRRLSVESPSYDWAVLGVDDDGEYAVYRPST